MKNVYPLQSLKCNILVLLQVTRRACWTSECRRTTASWSPQRTTEPAEYSISELQPVPVKRYDGCCEKSAIIAYKTGCY